MPATWNRRRKRFIRPGSQMEIVLFIVAVSWGSVLVNYVLFQVYLGSFLERILAPAHEAVLQTNLFRILFISLGVAVPVAVAMGVAATFRYFGPIYRFKAFLTDMGRGELGRECRIRGGDRLHDLCHAINRAAERIRADLRRDRLALRHAADFLDALEPDMPEAERSRVAELRAEIREALDLQPALGPAAPGDDEIQAARPAPAGETAAAAGGDPPMPVGSGTSRS